jgi:hypothetical protein
VNGRTVRDPNAPRFNPTYKGTAQKALASAKTNLEVARTIAANPEHLQQAAHSLVISLEESVRAHIYWWAYEDLVTFKPERRDERLYISERELNTKHPAKYAIAYAFEFGMMMIKIRPHFRGMAPEEAARMKADTGPWIAEKVPEFGVMDRNFTRLEDLRLGHYSGGPTTGMGRARITMGQFNEFAHLLDERLALYDFEQTVYVRPPGELRRIQNFLPEYLFEIRPRIEELELLKAKEKEAKKRPREAASRLPPSSRRRSHALQIVPS